MNCPTAEKGNKNCTCTYTSCERHGSCCACIAYHRPKNQMVGCYFTPEAERAYDRSMKFFLAQAAK